MSEESKAWESEAKRELAAGNKAGAIQIVRDHTQVGRREATELVEAWERAGSQGDEASLAPKLEGFAPLLQVFDMPTSVAFYRDLLGFTVINTSEPRSEDDFDWAHLRRDGIELMLNTAYDFGERPPEPSPERFASHDDTGLFFGCRDLDAAYSFFSSSGVSLEPPSVAPYGMKQLWLKDPDGYVLCLQWSAA